MRWRTGLLYVNHVGASVGYWVVMWEPTFNCMFNREEYLQYWVEALKEFDMQRQYEYVYENREETTVLVDGMDIPCYRDDASHCAQSDTFNQSCTQFGSTNDKHSDPEKT
ncbi:hypothetical protein GGF39_003678 [Coemansia sp. RSA 1721]|nr:hypothetical protein GGF39_003678 [Coemansia sp. RSA 1721]